MKNRNSSIHIVLGFCGLVLASGTFAADRPRDPAVNSRQRAQQNRIQQGGRSGELTAGETKSLKQEERSLRQEERAYKADGKLTLAERKDLHQDANQLSRDIYRQKHDAQAKPAAAPLPPPLPPRRRDPVVNARKGAQQARINQGVRSGDLTRPEAAQLRQQQKTIRTEERAYKADGTLTPAERKDLHQDLNQTSKDIYQQKHDAQTRPTVPASSAAK